ncbi:putative fatty acyl-CoA reductase CG5065 [Hyposmocoma kahamanoa]|uniref:putative fatty acyl-CoA reductase CG5065 n=1 Tax=Hyposmocoma kahamanoa TaxID=1477025 RepID=UPI000E6D81F6|nr:putative fatty acyl-CoA reductase CG5065 [Hyposmocoma kahamanoa]
MVNDLSVLKTKTDSPIINFYKEKCIFLSGGTGFLGTVIINKLLLTCKDLKNIYLLIKPKHNQSIKDRFDNLMNSKVFDKVRECNPNTLKKVIPISGNLLDDNLGLSQVDIQTLYNEVSIVFHSAANVNFNVPFIEAFDNNTRATEKMITFCKGIKQLQAFVYVSTAYSNCNKRFIDEKVYKTTNSLDSIKYFITQNGSNEFTGNLLDGRPNTYTYTKALTENLIANEIGAIPAVIVRPSIILGAESEPIPGWINGWKGLNNILGRQSIGQLHCWKADRNAVVDVIPVDYVANLTIAVAWDVHRRRNVHEKEVKVFNCCSGTRNPIQVGDLLEMNMKYSKKHVKQDVLIRPFFLIVKNYIVFWIIFFLVHTIPMYLNHIVDCVTKTKRGTSMIEMHRKLYNLVFALGFFALNQFIFIDRNVKDLYSTMNKSDQKMFNFDVENIKWDCYFENAVLGLKKNLLDRTPVQKISS